MNQFQKFNHDLVELTEQGVKEISRHANSYSEATRPVKAKEREWGGWSIASLWIGVMVSIPVYMLASGLIASGMNWWQALITIVLGHTIVIIPATLLAHCGTKYGISYTLLSKLIFGPKGNVFPTMIRALFGCFWFGIQCWIGGTAINSILNTILPFWNNFAPHAFLSFFLFLGLNVYIGYSGSTAIKYMENYAAPVLIILSLIVIGWAYHVAGGFSEIVNHKAALGNGAGFWTHFFPALTAMIAFDGTLALNMSDFTRHAKSQKSQIGGQFLGAPIMTAFIVFVGICGTIGSNIAFGETIWNPAELVSRFSNGYIVTIFSIFIVLATMTTNVAANLVPPGIVLSNLWPKKFTYKKAIMVVGLLAIAVMPWKVLENPNNYIYVVNGALATFLGPMAGIYLAGYWLEHKTRINLVDLYRINDGAYFYNNGWNKTAMCVLFGTTIFTFLGKFVSALSFFYNNSYVLGLLLSFGIYWIHLQMKKDGVTAKPENNKQSGAA